MGEGGEANLSREELIRIMNERLVLGALDAQQAAERERELRQELEQQRKELKRRYQALRRLEQAREEYISLISHDLRSPLTILLGYADLLRLQLDQKGLQQEARHAEAMAKSARRMTEMIGELVDSAHLGAGAVALQKAPLELPHVLADLLERVGTPADRARLRLEARGPMPLVLADRGLIERAVSNLLDNALRYSPPGSPVVVRVSSVDSRVVVAVTDRGVGIPAGELPLLFQRFYRARSAHKHEGLGLGLHITRLIVEAHGGEVGVDSRRGEGSTFRISLPAQS